MRANAATLRSSIALLAVLVALGAASQDPTGAGGSSDPEALQEDVLELLASGEVDLVPPEELVELLHALLPHMQQDEVELAKTVFALTKAAIENSDWNQGLSPEVTATIEQVFDSLFEIDQVIRGADVAFPLVAQLRRDGDRIHAESVLIRVTERLPSSDAFWPYFEYALAEMLLGDGRLGEARQHIERASLAVHEHEYEGVEALRSGLEGLRGACLLQEGRYELAYPLIREDLDAQRRLYEANPQGENLELLIAAHVQLANFYSETLQFAELLRDVDPVLDHTDWFESKPDALGSLLVHVGSAHLWLALSGDSHDDAGRPRLEQAEAAFARSLEASATRDQDRLRCELWTAYVEAYRDRWDRVGEWLARSSERLTRRSSSRETDTNERQLHAVLASRMARRSGDREAVGRSLRELGELLDEVLASWSKAPPRPGGVGYLADVQDRWVVSELIRLEVEMDPEGGPVRALEVYERARSLGSLVRELGGRPPSVERIRASLAEEEGVLVLLPLIVEGTDLLLVDSGGVRYVPAGSRAELLPLIEDFVTLLRSPPAKEPEERASRERRWKDLGDEIASGLFPREARSVLDRWRSVAIVGDDLAEYLPFEALPYGDELFGTRFAVRYAHSLSLDIALRDRLAAEVREPSAAGVVFLLEPVPGPGAAARYPFVAELELRENEREALLEPFAPDRLTRLSGAEASLDGLRSVLDDQIEILHVFAHGIQDTERELPAGLALSPCSSTDDGLAFASDLRDIHAPGLVLLSACGAGSGPTRLGDGGATDLGGAFLRAGAHTVVLSRSNLSVSGIVELMRGLEPELVNGVPTAEALRRARVRLRSSEHYRDPYYHSLIHAVGLADLPALSAGHLGARTNVMGWALPAGALVALALLLWRKRTGPRSA